MHAKSSDEFNGFNGFNGVNDPSWESIHPFDSLVLFDVLGRGRGNQSKLGSIERCTENLGQSLEQAFAKRVVSLLNVGSDLIEHSVSERLKAARNRALSNRKVEHVQPVQPDWVPSSALLGQRWLAGGPETQASEPFFSSGFGLFSASKFGRRLHAFLCIAPLVALFAGLFVVANVTETNAIAEKAVVDAQILVDELPPAAYLDRGFIQFMKQSAE